MNGPNLLLLQPLITGERPGKQDACSAPQGAEGKLLFRSTEDAEDPAKEQDLYPYADAKLL